MKKLSLGYYLEKTQENNHHTTTIYQGKYCPRSNISIGIIIAPVYCEQENDAYIKVYVWKFWLPMAGVEVFKTVPNPILNIVWILQWSKCGDKAAEEFLLQYSTVFQNEIATSDASDHPRRQTKNQNVELYQYVPLIC